MRDMTPRTEQQFTETLLNCLPGMAYQCENNQAWTMLVVSDGFESLTGYDRKALSDSNFSWANLVHADDIEAARVAVNAAIAAGEKFDIQYRILDKHGQEKWVREQGHCVNTIDTGEKIIEGYIDDISPIKNAAVRIAQSEIRRQHKQQAHADRLYMLGEMAAGMAHEINQPLTAISLFAQTGKRLYESGDFDQLQEIFDKLSRHSRRAGAIVERIQSMGRQKEGIRKTVDLNDLIEDAVVLAEVDARTSSIDIELDLAEDLPSVRVDVVQIHQVVLNLLRNGIDAMRVPGDHGENVISVKTRQRDDDFVEVAVIDSGSGVAVEVADQLFDSFLSTKSLGLGMGLPISKAIITAHGGQLAFQNNANQGATFTFTLPAPVRKGTQHG